MPGRCSLCRRVVEACVRARLTPDTVPLPCAGLPSLRAVHCPCTSGERARSLSARHLVHTARTSRPRPMHTTNICLIRLCRQDLSCSWHSSTSAASSPRSSSTTSTTRWSTCWPTRASASSATRRASRPSSLSRSCTRCMGRHVGVLAAALLHDASCVRACASANT